MTSSTIITVPTTKLSIVLFKGTPVGIAMNAISHLSAGMTNLAASSNKLSLLSFMNFLDADAKIYPSISQCSFVILQADTQAKLKAGYENARGSENLLANAFLTTMRGDTIVEQVERTGQVKSENVELIGFAVMGEKDDVNTVTKKFRLWV